MDAARAMLSDDAGLEVLKRSQLIELCKQFGIKCKGKNADLIAKLKEHGQSLLQSEGTSSLSDGEDPIDALPPSPKKASPLRRTESLRQLNPLEGPEASTSCAPPALGSFTFGADSTPAFNFTFACEKPSTAIADDEASQRVLDELNSRVAALMPSVPKQPTLGDSESNGFDKAHSNAFNKMDSITNHYAAKRPLDRSLTASHANAEASNKRPRLASSTMTNRTASSSSSSRSLVGTNKSVVGSLRNDGWLGRPAEQPRKALDKARAARKKSVALSRSPRKPSTVPPRAPFNRQRAAVPSVAASTSAQPKTVASGATSFARPTLSSMARSSPVKQHASVKRTLTGARRV